MVRLYFVDAHKDYEFIYESEEYSISKFIDKAKEYLDNKGIKTYSIRYWDNGKGAITYDYGSNIEFFQVIGVSKDVES